MSSCVAVMKEGIIQQVDSPDRIYRFPANLFVADFIGNPKVNLLNGEVDGNGCVNLDGFSVTANTRNAHGAVVVAVRPEDIAISTKPIPDGVEFNAYSVLPAGADTTIVARKGNTELNVREMGISKIRMDEKIWLKFEPATLNLYDKASSNLITA
jgi:multiple sugar transport system ATP-binding protein